MQEEACSREFGLVVPQGIAYIASGVAEFHRCEEPRQRCVARATARSLIRRERQTENSGPAPGRQSRPPSLSLPVGLSPHRGGTRDNRLAIARPTAGARRKADGDNPKDHIRHLRRLERRGLSRSASDFLLRHREDYATAYRDFLWPALGAFNWALDYFDVFARGNDAPALWIVDENGREDKVSFARMARRSAQVANWLRGLGVARGDRVLLLMPNEVALWECMLACMKLGAVIVPTTTLVATDDLERDLVLSAVESGT